MKNIFFSTFLTSVSLLAFAQNNQDAVLLNINDEPVYVSEFKAIYNKNNAVPTAEHKSVKEYLDLFINYKLKVKEAEELGLDTIKKFQDELAGYKKQLAQPYLVDTSVGESIIKEAYDRLKTEISASHILVKVSLAAAPSDTLKAYNKIMEYRKRLMKEDFKKVQAEIQKIKDPNFITENLGYFTAFQMVFPFETMAYKTNVGEISMPIRTSFGYHLLKVWDKRPSRGEVRVAHIMIKSNVNDSEEQQKQAAEKANELYNKIKSGESFETLCQMYSDDKGSSSKGGELPWFGPGRMVPEFEEAAFALVNPSDVSNPIKTSYGWHILKLLEKRKMGTFSEEKNNIKQKAQKDGRYNESRLALIQTLKHEYGVNPNQVNLSEMKLALTPTYFEGTWDNQTFNNASKELFSIKDDKYSKRTMIFTQKDFAEYLKKMAKKQEKPGDLIGYLNQMFTKFSDEKIIRFEEENLPFKYATYKALSKEYRDGILLFDLMDKKVWSKAMEDTLGLEKFYQANKTNYMWPVRVEAEIYACSSEDIAKKTKKHLKNRLKNKVSSDQIIADINKESQLNLSFEKNTYAKGEQALIDQVEWKKGIYGPIQSENKFNWVLIKNVLQSSPKTLQEARGNVTSDYQSFLEKEWISSLKNKYKVTVHESVLNEIK